MKIWALRIFLLLLLGAIVNVAVAWGCECLIKPVGEHVNVTEGWLALDQPVTQKGKSIESWVGRRETFGTSRLDSWGGWADRSKPEARSIVPYWIDASKASNRIQHGQLRLNASGWPMRSKFYSYAMEPTRLPDGQFGPVRFVISRGMALPPFDHARSSNGGVNPTYLRALSFMPLWPGFAINTTFYAAILWLLFVAPFALRRRRRIERGLCPKCAYDLRNRPSDSPACPECGSPRRSSP